MTEPIEITADNFEDEVVNSDIPVIVDLWGPNCGPCRALAPVLDKLAGEYDGKIKVGKINVREQRELAVAFNARSIPMVVAMKGRDVQNVMNGFRNEQSVRDMFDELLGQTTA